MQTNSFFLHERKMVKEKQSEFRQKIVDTAHKLLTHFGVIKTTMDDIARHLNKGKSTIYYYFKTKEDILHAVIGQEVDTLFDQVIAAVNKETLPQFKLRAYVIARIHGFNKLISSYHTFKDDYLRNYALVEEIRKQYDTKEMSIIHSILKDGVKQKLLSVTNIDLTAFVIVVALKGLEYYWATETDTKQIEMKIDTLLNVLLNGILKK